MNNSMVERDKGKLFLIGGAADTCLPVFAEMAGGTDAHVLIVPFATVYTRRNSDAQAAALADLGVGKVSVVSTRKALDGIDPDVSAVYMLGGDQERLVRHLGDSGKAAIARILRSGGLVAGTSAGAACAGDVMITGGMPDSKLRERALRVSAGLGIASGLIVDTHFNERNRFNRLMAAQKAAVGCLGVGIDEDTAVLIDGDIATVYGAGHATFFASSPQLFVSDDGKKRGDSPLAVGNVSVTALPCGYSFNLRSGQSVA